MNGRCAWVGGVGLVLGCAGPPRPVPVVLPPPSEPELPADPTPRLPRGAKLVPSEGHWDEVSCLAFSPDGRRLVSGSKDRTLLVWDMERGRVAARLMGHQGWVGACEFLPDGRHLVSAGWGGQVFVWDVETGRPLPVEGLFGTDDVYSLGTGSNGVKLLVGTAHGDLWGWDLATGEVSLEKTFWSEGSERIVRALGPTMGGGWIASGQLGTVIVGGEEEAEPQSWSSVASTSSLGLDDGRVLVGRQDGVYVIGDPKAELRLFAHDDWVRCLVVTPHEDAVLAGDQAGWARIWDLTAGTERCALKLPGGIAAGAIDPRGRRFAVAGSDATVRVYSLAGCADGKAPPAEHELAPRRTRMSSLAVAGTELGVGDDTGQLSVWDITTHRRIASVAAHRREITAVAALGNHEWVTSGADLAVLLHTVPPDATAATRELGRVKGVVATLQPMAGGREVLAGDAAGDLTRFLLESGKHQVLFEAGGRIETVTVDPQGSRVVVGGLFNELGRLDVANWDEEGSPWPEAFPDRALSTTVLAFGPTGDRVAQGGTEGALQLRAAVDGAVMQRLTGLRREIRGLVFTSPTDLWAADGSGALAHFGLDHPEDATPSGTHLDSPAASLVQDPEHQRLYAALEDGRVVELATPTAERTAELVTFRDGSWATLLADGRFVVEGASAKQLEFELPDRRVVTTAGTSPPPHWGTTVSDRVAPRLARVRATVFSPGGLPQLELDGQWAIRAVVPNHTVKSAYEIELFCLNEGGGEHVLTATDPSGRAAETRIEMAPDPSRTVAGVVAGVPGMRALLVGNSAYFAHDHLPGSSEDVGRVKQLLTEEPHGLELPPGAVGSRYDLDARTLRAEVRAFFASATPEQTLLFYFSGHGSCDAEQAYLLPVDDSPTRRAEALSAAELWEATQSSPAKRILVLLDASRRGAFVLPNEIASAIHRSERVLFMMATGPAKATTGSGGAYTRALLEALRDGTAIDRELGAVTLRRLHDTAMLALEAQPPRLLGAPGWGRMVVFSPALEVERRAELVAGAAAFTFRTAPEVRRPPEGESGAASRFAAGNDHRLRFAVFVTEPVNALQARVVRHYEDAAADAPPRPLYLHGQPIPAQTQLGPVDLPLDGLVAGTYDLIVEPCERDTTGHRVCGGGATFRFELK
ncbi:MAG: caspase family protein [Polyangiaceae bacterium]|nr:caspase family protein [Polyangiaceae bacterium]